MNLLICLVQPGFETVHTPLYLRRQCEIRTEQERKERRKKKRRDKRYKILRYTHQQKLRFYEEQFSMSVLCFGYHGYSWYDSCDI